MGDIETALLEPGKDSLFPLRRAEAPWPILICVLGTFCVLRADQPLRVRGGKMEALLCHLALRYDEGSPRDTLLVTLWPDTDTALASEALYGRLYNLHKLMGAALGGAAPVVHTDGCYRLNCAAGVGVDVACFDALATRGDQHTRAGHAAQAAAAYQQAIQLYRGDLCAGTDVHAVVERERLRGRYLGLLASLATFAYSIGDYAACLDYALRMLSHDPCREDAYRLVMRCHVRRGERAQALHQFRVCAAILRAECDAMPEPATVALFDQVRLDPSSILFDQVRLDPGCL
jgi:DNA-binding SARP family transcriptional activator